LKIGVFEGGLGVELNLAREERETDSAWGRLDGL
jgi:hypothetical protein